MGKSFKTARKDMHEQIILSVKKDYKRLNLYMDGETYLKLIEIAEFNDRSMSSMLKIMIKTFYPRMKQKKAEQGLK